MTNFEMQIGNQLEGFNNVDEFKGALKALLKKEEPFSMAIAKKEESCLKEIAKILNEKGMKMQLEESDPLAIKFFTDVLKDAKKFGAIGAALGVAINAFYNASATALTTAVETEAVAAPADFIVPGSAEFVAFSAGIGAGIGALIGIGKKIIKLKLNFKVLKNGEEGVTMEFCFASSSS